MSLAVMVAVLFALTICAVAAFVIWGRAARRERMTPPAVWAVKKPAEQTAEDTTVYDGWSEVLGTVVSGKVETHSRERRYCPVFSYVYHGKEYTSAPKSGHSAAEYPLGTVVTLLVSENDPLEILVLPKLEKSRKNMSILALLLMFLVFIMVIIVSILRVMPLRVLLPAFGH